MCSILICDDDASYRLLVREVLEPLGAEILGEAGDGRECIEMAERLSPDVVLLDLNMPGMDGLTALPELRARVPGATVVVLSTAQRDDAEQRSVTLGARSFVRKPADIFSLPSTLRAAVAA